MGWRSRRRLDPGIQLGWWYGGDDLRGIPVQAVEPAPEHSEQQALAPSEGATRPLCRGRLAGRHPPQGDRLLEPDPVTANHVAHLERVTARDAVGERFHVQIEPLPDSP